MKNMDCFAVNTVGSFSIAAALIYISYYMHEKRDKSDTGDAVKESIPGVAGLVVLAVIGIKMSQKKYQPACMSTK